MAPVSIHPVSLEVRIAVIAIGDPSEGVS